MCYLCVYFWRCWVFIAMQAFSLVAASGGSSLVVVRGLLTAVASLDAEHRLSSSRASAVAALGALEHRLHSCGIFLDPGLNLCLPHWQWISSPLSHQGIPSSLIFFSSLLEIEYKLHISPHCFRF